jgi:hypothetical protein
MIGEPVYTGPKDYLVGEGKYCCVIECGDGYRIITMADDPDKLLEMHKEVKAALEARGYAVENIEEIPSACH